MPKCCINVCLSIYLFFWRVARVAVFVRVPATCPFRQRTPGTDEEYRRLPTHNNCSDQFLILDVQPCSSFKRIL